MSEWWHSLDGAAQIFWAIAIAATVFQLLLFASSLIGGHDLDHVDFETGEGASADGLKFLSLRAIIAFLVGFGWTGGLMMNRGFGPFVSALAGLGVGIVFMVIIAAIMRGMMALHDDGTLDFKNAIGQPASVYVTIPAKRAGRGQVEMHLQGRLVTVQAITEAEVDLSPNTKVTVTALEGSNVLLVSPST